MYDLTGPHATGLAVPLLRSFSLYGFQLGPSTKDSVQVIVEEINIFRKPTDKSEPGDPNALDRNGGSVWAKTEGDLFVISKGIVAVADLDDPNVEPDSSLSGGLDREVFAQNIGSSRSCLVIGEDRYPCAGPCEQFKAYGFNGGGAFIEFPGLHIRQSGDLPAALQDQQIFTTGSSYGCIEYDIPIRFDSARCSFITVPPDSGFIARCPVDKYVFNRYGDSVRIAVRQDPSADSRNVEAILARTDSSYVTRILYLNKAHWVLLEKNGKILGWIDEAGIALLQLNACG
jgi:hypothetical protein